MIGKKIFLIIYRSQTSNVFLLGTPGHLLPNFQRGMGMGKEVSFIVDAHQIVHFSQTGRTQRTHWYGMWMSSMQVPMLQKSGTHVPQKMWAQPFSFPAVKAESRLV